MTSPAQSHTSPRRTQEERRTGTRKVLMEATIASLIDVGYQRTTTSEIECKPLLSAI